MTAEEHLKIAASELQKAADAVRNDVNQLRSDVNDIKQSNNLQLVRLEEELSLVRRQQFTPTDPQQKQQVNQRIVNLQQQINDKQREMQEEIRRVSDLIRQKEKDAEAIIGQARAVAPF